jgi:superoxide dismutase, Fe-Mn family
MITRREALQQITVLAAATGPAVQSVLAQAAAPAGPFKVPPLGYAFDALEPYIDARTMEIHHDRHHATYVANLNKAVGGGALAEKSVEDLIKNLSDVPEGVRKAVRNNGGGHYNHTLFWQLLKRDGGKPRGELGNAIEKKFGSLDAFKDEFTKASLAVFGSGWVWLSLAGSGAVQLDATPNQDSPLMDGRTPLLGIDLWEHAYYLKYQNKRADYVAAFWNVINWDFVSERYARG